MKNWGRAALVALAMWAGTAAAQDVPAAAPIATVLTPDDALKLDALDYARRHAVAPEEALRRLRAQEESVAETDAIEARYRDRLAGMAIEHDPEYRIVVLLTGDDPVGDYTIPAGGMDVPVIFRTGAPATRADLLAAINLHQAELRAALPRAPGLGVDPRTGELVVMTSSGAVGPEGEDALAKRLEAIAGVPVQLRFLDQIDANAAVEGGSRVTGVNPANGVRYVCTTGFVVTDGARTGIVTAAHCPDSLEHVDPAKSVAPLEFAGQWGWSFQDVQLHLAPGPLAPLFYGDTARTLLRPVAAVLPRARTRAGDVVCHRGERSGYSCAEVALVDFAPAGDLCGGPCAPTWVAVEGPTCRGGDSGGPVFLGATALGLVKGASYRADGRCQFYYYMSTDYLPQGWSVLQEGEPRVAPG